MPTAVWGIRAILVRVSRNPSPSPSPNPNHNPNPSCAAPLLLQYEQAAACSLSQWQTSQVVTDRRPHQVLLSHQKPFLLTVSAVARLFWRAENLIRSLVIHSMTWHRCSREQAISRVKRSAMVLPAVSNVVRIRQLYPAGSSRRRAVDARVMEDQPRRVPAPASVRRLPLMLCNSTRGYVRP